METRNNDWCQLTAQALELETEVREVFTVPEEGHKATTRAFSFLKVDLKLNRQCKDHNGWSGRLA